MGAEIRIGAVVPTFDNPRTVRGVVQALQPHVEQVVVVDDGSGPDARAVIDDLAREGLADVVRRPSNGGKGAAMRDGFERAHQLGLTHALQIDADGQHAIADVPAALDEARAHPSALIVGLPIFDETIPRSRLWGRKLSVFWVGVETGGRFKDDPLCGFRVYPLAATRAAMERSRADRMDFDPEVLVRMVWAGTPVRAVSVHVRYLRPEEGGVSHFRMVRDNLLISWMHTRLCATFCARVLFGKARG